jgi:UDP-N-acetyl-D-mannosaminuronic acid transferase (WecB/TagA/CpsF family)
VWRLAMEPRRMAHRYLVGNALFLAHSLRQARAVRLAHRPLPA